MQKQNLNLHTRQAVFLVIALLPFNSAIGQPQTLNEVVSNQLATVAGNPCLRLLANDSAASVLTGDLQTLCSRNALSGASPAASAGGGGAATPASLPRIIKKRLKNTDENDKGVAASSDQVFAINNAFSLFVSGEYQSLDRDVTTFQDGYDSDIWRFNAGADYRIANFLTIGAAFDYRNHDGDYVTAGGFEQNSYGVIGFLSITPTDNWFIQLSGGYADQNTKRSRLASFTESGGISVSGIASSKYDAQEYSASFQSGFDFTVNQFTFGPRVGVDWVRTEYDSYTETGNSGLELRFAEDRRTSLQSRLGMFGSAAFSTSFGVIIPQVGLDWVHEFANDQRDIRFSFAGDLRNKTFSFNNEKPDRDFIEFNVGTSIVIANGVQGFVNYRAIASHRYFNAHSANVGVRMEF